VRADGTPTAVFGWLKPLNRAFVAIGRQLQGLESLDVSHAGMIPPGATAPPADAAFRFDPPLPDAEFRPGERVRGLLVGTFGIRDGDRTTPTHAMIVNLDTKAPFQAVVRGGGPLERFDAETGRWIEVKGDRVEMALPPGGGQLIRLRR
jgi:hypothetical protein